MNDETDHNTGHESASHSPSLRHSSTHRQSLRLAVAQNEGLVFGATGEMLIVGAINAETPTPPSELHPEPTRSVVSKDIKETPYGDDPHTIIDLASGETTTFEHALKARYERLSLLTLDLAEEAEESARHFSTIKPKRVTQGIASMTKAIWAHRVIEKLRTGKAVRAEDLAGLLPGYPYAPSGVPCGHPSTPNPDYCPDCIRGVVQEEGRGVGRDSFSTHVYHNNQPSFNTLSQRPSTSTRAEALGSDATNGIPLDHVTRSETSTPHSEPYPALSRAAGHASVSRNPTIIGYGNAGFGESTEGIERIETEKEKPEIKKTTHTPHRRKLEVESQAMHPTGERCGFAVTREGEKTPPDATHTDKTMWSGIKAEAHPHQAHCLNQVRPPP